MIGWCMITSFLITLGLPEAQVQNANLPQDEAGLTRKFET